MQKESNSFSFQDAAKLANTPAGRQLLTLLQQSDTSTLQDAMEQAKAGNFEQAQKVLSPLLASPEVQKLLRELGGK